ncbi:carboxypeptidase-like regulatory domain-containing protein [Herpetosiphon gulosus]|uniref:Carboxypeptidase regulatory-like domain-containing protein n=1 Tax=Herpetosiphon gulosus TaxID=1973496 RepID=A0ABP9X726_9CHLR
MKLFLLVFFATLTPVVAGRGDLTLLIRDPAGQPLPQLTVTVFHDTDDAGRVLVATVTTDATGRIMLPQLAWGLYIVQFQGEGIQAAEQQNMGLLDDGGGVSNGFGVRFAETARTERFVLTPLNGEPALVPLFDMAASDDAPPQPYDPLLAMIGVPTPTPFLLRDVVEGRVDASGQPIRARWDAGCLIGLGLILWGMALIAFLGWWRLRRPRPPIPTKEANDAGLDG